MTNQKNISNKTVRRRARLIMALSLAVGLALPAMAKGQPTSQPSTGLVANANPQTLEAGSLLRLMVGKSSILSTKTNVKRVNVASPEIADVNPIGPQSVLVTAKKAGSTQLIVWDENDKSQVMDVTVEVNLAELKKTLGEMIPGSKIDVTAPNGAIALRGQVPSLQAAEQAVQVAS